MVTAYEEELARLEQFVERLLENYNALKAEHTLLKERFQEKELENKEFQEVVNSLQNDRKVVHNRVTGLIDKIEEWEKSFDNPEGAPAFSEKKQDGNVASREMDHTFSMGIEQDTSGI